MIVIRTPSPAMKICEWHTCDWCAMFYEPRCAMATQLAWLIEWLYPTSDPSWWCDLLESEELTSNDLELLRRWDMNAESPGARKLILIGRLQDALGVIMDGKWGPNTDKALRQHSYPLGPKLARIVDEERAVRR